MEAVSDVPVVVNIRKNSTGEIRQKSDTLCADEGGTVNPFVWEDGNYSCDCNRRLFFARANGEDEDWEGDCSDGEYSVEISDSAGVLLYSEFRE